MIEPARDLTVPESTATMRRMLSGALRRSAEDLLRLRGPALEGVRAAFASELRAEPGRAFVALRKPSIGALIHVLYSRGYDEELACTLAATLAVELASAGAKLPPLTFARTPPHVLCLGGRFALPGGGPAALRERRWQLGDRSFDLRSDDLERPFHAISSAIVLATRDDNPLAMEEAHPDKFGNAVDLGAKPVDAWIASLRDALSIIERHMPPLREEMELVLQSIVPVGADDEKHLSASYRETLGTIYLTLHPSVMTLTEALIHEHSHNKLNTVFALDAIVENAPDERYASPVRSDPRPLHGVLLAVHAFLPVAELYRRMLAAGDSRADPHRYQHIVRGNRDGMSILLEHARPTAVGAALLEEMRELCLSACP
jgi:HEXXH motif-containing protein